jgi:hypothetical protein
MDPLGKAPKIEDCGIPMVEGTEILRQSDSLETYGQGKVRLLRARRRRCGSFSGAPTSTVRPVAQLTAMRWGRAQPGAG